MSDPVVAPPAPPPSEAGCDSSTICDMLGSEQGVTYKNILQYMGLIEQRTMELIKIQQYIQMKVPYPSGRFS
ncbi:hypothetical protein MAR_009807 [Mya arenaria]|uniref:Uncharacterized protein n=1 Tax=Mya arenaria TaxID=6604 RepID=A0ABY7E207_MYAAR|nr:hypothetical protein MAR_009807 [Mya arenaria]